LDLKRGLFYQIANLKKSSLQANKNKKEPGWLSIVTFFQTSINSAKIALLVKDNRAELLKFAYAIITVFW